MIFTIINCGSSCSELNWAKFFVAAAVTLLVIVAAWAYVNKKY